MFTIFTLITLRIDEKGQESIKAEFEFLYGVINTYLYINILFKNFINNEFI